MRRAAARLVGLGSILAPLLALTGCGESDGSPVAWWHQLEGGRIAEARPAPPRADAPYPHLSSVPERPAMLDAAERTRIASLLTRDRTNAEYAAAAQPLSPPAAAPPQYAPPKAAPAVPADGPNATMAAVTAPPAPAAARPPAPARAGAVARPGAGGAAGPMPGIPLAPPPPPNLPGVPAATRPSPAPVAPPASAASLTVVPGQPVPVAFAGGSAALPSGAEAALAKLAATRGGGAMRVQGFGDAESDDPAVQAAALPLAFARADSIANALARAGVPEGQIRLSAAAQGHGGLATVAN